MVQLHQSPEAKKLTGAVDHWFGLGSDSVDNSEYLADLARYGIQLDNPPPELEETHYEVWPDLWTVVSLFLRCSTQWRTGPGGIVGLDYGPVLGVLALYAEPEPLAVIDDLRIMENRALELFTKQQDKQMKAARRNAKRRP